MTNNRHLTLLKYDVKAWNSWRQENYQIKLDFSQANLSNLNLSGVNLSGVNLSGVNLSRTKLKCADLKDTNLSQACLVNTDLSGADLSDSDLTEANLNQANLSSANLQNANLTNVTASLTNFSKSILTGACIENWQIDRGTNLDNLICDYFYKKQENQERYPRNKQENFAPGECIQFIRNDLDYVDALILAQSNSTEENQQQIELGNNALDPLDNKWEENTEKLSFKAMLPAASTVEQIKSNKIFIYLLLAFLLGTIGTAIAFWQIFNKSSLSTSSDNLISCDNSLLQQAENAIFTLDNESLQQAMQQLEKFSTPLGGFADKRCKQALYEVKYAYAIEVKAKKDSNLLEAVALLCDLPEQYFQENKYKPWFLRWTNSFANTDFPRQLEEYIENNGCPAANYLSQNQQ